MQNLEQQYFKKETEDLGLHKFILSKTPNAQSLMNKIQKAELHQN